MIFVVFVEPETPGNIGFLARTMKNFGLKKLILINPPPLDEQAIYHAMHAQEILENCDIYSSLEDFLEKREIEYAIATTGTAGSSYNVPRIAITPKNLAETMDRKIKTGIIFGREGDGLTNKELELCDVLVSIPTHPDYPIMNISHAAAVIFYELYHSQHNYPVEEVVESSLKEREDIINYLDQILDTLDYPLHKHRNTLLIFRRIVGRAFISRREAHNIKGLFRKIRDQLKKGV